MSEPHDRGGHAREPDQRGELRDPVTTIASPAPNGSLSIRLRDSVKPGAYFLKALDAHNEYAAQSVEFYIN